MKKRFSLFGITGAMERAPDQRNDSCDSPLIFVDNFESGGTSNWS